MDDGVDLTSAHANGRYERSSSAIRICKIDLMRNIAGAIMPIADGIHPESATTKLPNVYFRVYDLIGNGALK